MADDKADVSDDYLPPDGTAASSIVAVGHPFDGVYRVECPCTWRSIPVGASEAGREQKRHHQEHKEAAKTGR